MIEPLAIPAFLEPYEGWLTWLGIGAMLLLAVSGALYFGTMLILAAIDFGPTYLYCGRPKNIMELTSYQAEAPDQLLHRRLKIAWWLVAGRRHDWMIGFIRLRPAERGAATD